MKRNKIVKKEETPKKAKKTEKIVGNKPVWKKITRGTLYPFPKQRGVRVEPNKTIEATEEEIARFRDQFELVKDGTGIYRVKKDEPTPPPPGPEPEVYTLAPENGAFNVLSEAGKKMNETPLSLEEAEELKSSLEKVTTE